MNPCGNCVINFIFIQSISSLRELFTFDIAFYNAHLSEVSYFMIVLEGIFKKLLLPTLKFILLNLFNQGIIRHTFFLTKIRCHLYSYSYSSYCCSPKSFLLCILLGCLSRVGSPSAVYFGSLWISFFNSAFHFHSIDHIHISKI